jgi:hypothetical protein
VLYWQLNEAQLSYSSVGSRLPRWPAGAAVTSRFQPPALATFTVHPHRTATLYQANTATAAGSLSASGASRVTTEKRAPGSAAALADRDAARGGETDAMRTNWASNAPGITARDVTPMPRTPATPEAAPRAHPAAVKGPPLSSLSSQQGQTSRSNPGTTAALAAAVFGKAQRPIYR